MKKFLIVSWLIFALGLVFNFLYLPGNSLLKIIGCTLIFSHSLVYLTKNIKLNPPLALIFLTFSLWTIYLLFRIQFWPYAQFVFIVAFLTSLACLIVHVINKTKIKFPQIVITVYFVLSIALSYIHSAQIFYFFRLNKVLNSDYRDFNYRAWDKYSWFLYIADKQDEAIKANQNALNAVELSLKNSLDNQVARYEIIIQNHTRQIQERSWTDYP